MRGSGRCRALVSEEEENIIYFDEHPNARYVVACDPIDGSSNLDAGVSVGTIFGIMKLPESAIENGRQPDAKDLLMPGTELLASGFTMYGASAQLVITMKGGAVSGFTLVSAFHRSTDV
jgi:fructose-1,6-bisphosphatase I